MTRAVEVHEKHMSLTIWPREVKIYIVNVGDGPCKYLCKASVPIGHDYLYAKAVKINCESFTRARSTATICNSLESAVHREIGHDPYTSGQWLIWKVSEIWIKEPLDVAVNNIIRSRILDNPFTDRLWFVNGLRWKSDAEIHITRGTEDLMTYRWCSYKANNTIYINWFEI